MKVKKILKSKNNKNIATVILCGGIGMRLRPLTNNIPKPLINIKNKPILYYIRPMEQNPAEPASQVLDTQMVI